MIFTYVFDMPGKAGNWARSTRFISLPLVLLFSGTAQKSNAALQTAGHQSVTVKRLKAQG